MSETQIPAPPAAKKSRGKRPSHAALVGHWAPLLIKRGKITCDADVVNPRFDCGDPKLRAACFACGRPAPVEIAHIRAHRDGGCMAPGNLHVLCSACHKDSEFLSGAPYWLWFDHVEFRNATLRWTDRLAFMLGAKSPADLGRVCAATLAEHGGDHVAAAGAMKARHREAMGADIPAAEWDEMTFGGMADGAALLRLTEDARGL